MPDSIAFARSYTSVIDELYQGASVTGVLNSGQRMVRTGRNAKEVLTPGISVTGLGNYTSQRELQDGRHHLQVETKTFTTTEASTCSRM